MSIQDQPGTRSLQRRNTARGPARRRRLRAFAPLALAVAAAIGIGVPAGAGAATGQCTTVASGLREPVGSTMTAMGNLLVGESGDGAPDSGRISIIDRKGNRRTLLDGLPSGPADVGTPSGPSGLTMQGRSLFVAIGEGDIGIKGPLPGTTLLNPAGVSSPIFASVLELNFSGLAEARTTGFHLTHANQATLAKGVPVVLHDSGGNSLLVRLVSKLPPYLASPIPNVPDNIHATNPFGIASVGFSLYVTDGGRNSTWRVARFGGAASEFAHYPDIPNPLFAYHVGGPFIQAVPTGIRAVRGQLLVSLFRGAPFATGVSTVEALDPFTGTHSPLLSGLTTAIDTAPVRHRDHDDLLVLEMSSAGPFFSGPAAVLRFHRFAGAPEVVADCIASPTSMSVDGWTHKLYVTEEEGGLVSIPLH